MEIINAVGRRKTAVARVFLRPGEGKIIINNRSFEDYFPLLTLQTTVLKPFELTGTLNKFDVTVNMTGGGFKGQAEALRHGIARALVKIDPEYRPVLKSNGLLRRDPRMVERKKYGQKKARKRFQFSKR